MSWRSDPAILWIADHLIAIQNQTSGLQERIAAADQKLNETRQHLFRQDRDLAVIKKRLRQNQKREEVTWQEWAEIIKALWPLLVFLAALSAKMFGTDGQWISSLVISLDQGR